MKKRELLNLGLERKADQQVATACFDHARREGLSKDEIRLLLRQVISNPAGYLDHLYFAPLAKQLMVSTNNAKVELPVSQVSYRTWGSLIDDEAHEQMRGACSLPIARGGALMPDAHVGYGLPIGGVLATENAVIPYAVGVDIGCRVKVTITDLSLNRWGQNPTLFIRALEDQTRFGTGVQWEVKKNHPVLDLDWSVSPLVARLKDLAWKQLGTSGSGNHFVEFGEMKLVERLGSLEPGRYVALVSHSGSRGPGAAIANHYSSLAALQQPHLPSRLKHLAWLSLDSQEGQEYWHAMELMGEFASANHHIIHHEVLRAVGARSLEVVENHHNFAWKESYDGTEYVVHRKGATPAGEGVKGYIPGTMIDPGYLIEGLGNRESFASSAHGAGRMMSRKKAKNTTTRYALLKSLKEAGVTLLDAGLDESPHAYKRIEDVMQEQRDLVKVLGTFSPKFVKMAPDGERPED